MTRAIRILAVAATVLIVAPASAATILIDLGRTDNTTAATGWNNISGAASGPTLLIDSNGDPTAYSQSVSQSNAGASGSGADSNSIVNLTSPTGVIYPDTASRDSVFTQTPTSGTSFITVTLSNLNPLLAYDFYFFGSAGNTGGTSRWTVTGSSVDVTTLAVLNNTSNFAQVLGMAPDGSNQITILFDFASSPGRWNTLEIVEAVTVVPTPSALPAGLGLLALGVGRRRRMKQ